MNAFRNGQRVRVVTDCAIKGKVGTVTRVCINTDQAWVDIDELPDAMRSFPKGDTRQNHIKLWPEDCELVKEA